MRNLALGLAACLLLASCTHLANTEYADMIAFNKKTIAKLEIGMAKDKAVRLLRHESFWHGAEEIKNPWLIEKEKLIDGTVQETYWYLTRRRANFTSYRKALATPLVFEDGVLVSVGVGAAR